MKLELNIQLIKDSEEHTSCYQCLFGTSLGCQLIWNIVFENCADIKCKEGFHFENIGGNINE